MKDALSAPTEIPEFSGNATEAALTVVPLSRPPPQVLYALCVLRLSCGLLGELRG